MLQAIPEELRGLLAAAVAEGEARGARLWLVGGVVRDMLRGRPLSRDVDLAVEGEVVALARGLAAATSGRVTAAHPAFETATVEAPGPAGGVVIDLARTRIERYTRPAALPEVAPAPIAADLIRRDFSINAMALELRLARGALQTGRLLDPYGGQADLAAGRLRLLHAASLRDDPTRMLRGVRLAARLGMAPEPASSEQIGAALTAGYLGMLTAERALAELCLALEEPRPDEVLRVADEWGLTGQILPGVGWGAALAARCARYAIEAEPGKEPLVWAGLLLYDLDAMGLAQVARRYPLPGDAATLLRQITALRASASSLAGAVANSAIDRLLRPYGTAAIRVLHYAEPAAATATARYMRFLRPARAPLDGNDLRRLGVAPGPLMGRLLEELRAAALDGIITTRPEAEAWVRARVGSEA